MTMINALEPCPDCGSTKHKSCKPQTLDRDLMTRKQAADYLGITPQTVSKLVNQGKLDVWRSSDAPNARMRIKTVSIEKMLEGRRK